MRARTHLWFSLVWALVPIAVGFGLLFVDSAVPAVGNSPLAAQTAGAGAWVIVMPWLALCCAIIARRLVEGARVTGSRRRGPVARILGQIALPVVATTAAVLLVGAIYASGRGVLAWPTPSLGWRHLLRPRCTHSWGSRSERG
ncbi:hypothetical protein FB459_1935 [Yimella lutea]|uniref:Uncharacterized protein n=1 Tax=Yimella lutea TaxID=587872 RepID=A0A542EGK4_9MICO|nr:hypothetical protein [Yimella lutea]TQJ14471.1 hypothetical protein FB459_1935 [Yimella lutea]